MAARARSHYSRHAAYYSIIPYPRFFVKQNFQKKLHKNTPGILCKLTVDFCIGVCYTIRELRKGVAADDGIIFSFGCHFYWTYTGIYNFERNVKKCLTNKIKNVIINYKLKKDNK